MKKQTLLSFALFFIITVSVAAQISTKKEALDTINWLIENPQLDSDSLFVKKSTDLIKWQFTNNPRTPMKFGGLKEFMNSSRDYKLFNEVTIVYMLNEFRNKIENKNFNDKDSAYNAIKDVLKYYTNVLQIDDSLRDKILDEYNSLSDSELKKKIKNLIK